MIFSFQLTALSEVPPFSGPLMLGSPALDLGRRRAHMNHGRYVGYVFNSDGDKSS